MREIKFRAWNESANRHSKPFTFKSSVLSYTDDDGLGVVKSLTDEIIEQYTGLKDKNGKEIYEGDIVNWVEEINQCNTCKNEDSELIEWLDKFCTNCGTKIVKEDYKKSGNISFEHFRWNIVEDGMCHCITGALLNTLEVIGNIHKNQ